MKYVTMQEFKKINPDFLSKGLKSRTSIFYGEIHTEKKFNTVAKLADAINNYWKTFSDYKMDIKRVVYQKSLAYILAEGKLVIRKGQTGFNKNVGIKNAFSPFNKFISLLESGDYIDEKRVKAFLTRLYDYADYNIGIYFK